MKGTTEECFKHLVTQLPAPGTRDATRARKPMVEFLDIQDASIRRWIGDSILPIGLVLVKLRFMLEDLGYEVKELKTLPVELYNLGQILAYGAMSVEDVARELGYDASTSKNSVYRLVHEGASRLGAKLSLVQALWTKHEIIVQRERQKWRDTFENLREAVDRSKPGDNIAAFPDMPGTRTPMPSASRVSPIREPDPEAAPTPHHAGDPILAAFGHSLLATASLTEQVLDRPAGDRRIALESVGGRRGLIRLAQNLLQLAEEGN